MKALLFAIASAVLLIPASAGASAKTAGHTVELSSGRVDGSLILGKTLSEVTAALGRPDFRAGSSSRYRIGWGPARDFRLEVLFWPSDRGLRAWSVVLERGPVSDPKVGDLLGRSPEGLQRAVRAKYATTFKLLHPLACKRSGDCIGAFISRSSTDAGRVHLSFGTQPHTGTWLTIWRPFGVAR